MLKNNMFYDTEDLRDGEIMLQLERTAEGNPEKNWVPAYYFGICLADGTRIGQCDTGSISAETSVTALTKATGGTITRRKPAGCFSGRRGSTGWGM